MKRILGLGTFLVFFLGNLAGLTQVRACGLIPPWSGNLSENPLTYKEPFGVAHQGATISLVCPKGVDFSRHKLVDVQGREVPYQISRDGKTLLVRTDLAPREERTWTWVPGIPSPGKGLIQFSENRENGWIELTHDKVGIRIPDGRTFTDETALLSPAELTEAGKSEWHCQQIRKKKGLEPKNWAPVQGIRLRNGVWTAQGPNLLKAEPLAKSMKVEILEKGPLETVVRVHYEFQAKPPVPRNPGYPTRNPGYPGGEGHYTCTITVKAFDPVIRFDEESDRIPVSWKMNFWPEWKFDTARHPAGKPNAIKTVDTTDFTPQPPWTEKAFGRLWPFGLHPFSNTFYLLSDSQGDEDSPVVGAFVDSSGDSVQSHFSEAEIFRGKEEGGIQKAMGFSSPDASVWPYVRHSWGLLLGTKKEELLPLDQPQPIEKHMARLAGHVTTLRNVTAPIPELPRLDREERSDWINVKSRFGAIGDGKADDAPALQKALDSLKPQGYDSPNTIYLPPGTYRITRTLRWKNLYGKRIFGHGRDTRIVWDGDGSSPPVMFHSDGATAGVVFEGIIWDGAGKAEQGICHCSSTHYESHVIHRHEAFVNLVIGVFSGHSSHFPYKQATAEVTFQNCLFANVQSGLVFLSYNALDNSVVDCDFHHCGTGIRNITGNVYVRNCHFVGSRDWDIYTHVGDCSALRCTSQGSHRFLHNNGRIFTMQDCHVEGWKSPRGAVEMLAGPLTLFDCSFRHPPSEEPPVQGRSVPVLLSQCTSPDTKGVLGLELAASAIEIPKGQSGPSVSSAKQTFFQSSVSHPGKVFDVKRDFGAKGDGKVDDTIPILRALSAAKRHGQNAIAYFPCGQYRVTRTIEISGKDYSLGGAGLCWQSGTRVFWGGSRPRNPSDEAIDTAVFRIKDAQNVTIEGMQVGTPSDYLEDIGVASFLHEGSTEPTLVTYDDVGGFGQFRGLGAKDQVRIRMFGGILDFDSCQRASVVVDQFHPSRHPQSKRFSTTLRVRGRDQSVPKDGLLGFLTFYNAGNPVDVTVQDSQNLVVSDYYTEQTWRVLRLEGKPGDTPGRVTLLAHKFHGEHVDDLIQVRNYRGSLFLSASPLPQVPIKDPAEAAKSTGGTMAGIKVKTVPLVFSQEGDQPFDAILGSCIYEGGRPILRIGEAASVALIADTLGNKDLTSEQRQRIAAAMDDLRRLGKADLEIRSDLGK